MSKPLHKPQAAKPAAAAPDTAFLTADYLPQAQRVIGGLFRYDMHVTLIRLFLQKEAAALIPQMVAGALPCAWSLALFGPRPVIPLNYVQQIIGSYLKRQCPLLLTFDNPFVSEAELKDPYANAVLEHFCRVAANTPSAICVASDALGEHIRKRYPWIKLWTHPNMAEAEPAAPGADWYNRLLRRYAMVSLHPEDAVNPAVLRLLNSPERIAVVMNDPRRRCNPKRRDIVQLQVASQRNPYNSALTQQLNRLRVEHEQCRIAHAAKEQLQSANLTHNEARALYKAGVRTFVVQSSRLRHETTFIGDIFWCFLSDNPELTNKNAVVQNFSIGAIGRFSPALKNGLEPYAFPRPW